MYKRPARKVQKDKTVTRRFSARLSAQPKPQTGFQLAFSALLDMLGHPNHIQRRTYDS